MGGFHLFEHRPIKTTNDDEFKLHDDDIPLCPLAARDLYGDFRYKSIRADIDFTSFTVPTEEEIKDKGKSDWLAKSVVLLQTSWFVMQCIARAIEHLPITHLEIVTLAYAAMNFVIFIFWWNKPLNVNRPVRVFRKSEPSATQHQVMSRGTQHPRMTKHQRPRGTQYPRTMQHPKATQQPRATQHSRAKQHSRAWELTWGEIGDVLERIAVFVGGLQDKGVNLRREESVPRFWADSTDEQIIADAIVLGVGVCFGAIHCISWGFTFPTDTELLMWRVLCVAITAVPIYISLGFYLGLWLYDMDFGKTVLYFIPLSGGILYILARVVTLVLAFTSLRDLPPGAYETVHWTTFIPHV